MAFQKKERPSILEFKIDFLDKLYDLDFIGDKEGQYRNHRYLMMRVYRFFRRRQEYIESVINPLIAEEMIDVYIDSKWCQWGPSYTLTAKGRSYLESLDITFDQELARQILRLIIKEEAKDTEEIIGKMKGKARLVRDHLLSLITRNILDSSDNRYSLTPTAYLIYTEIKSEAAEKIVREVEPENKERFENLLSQLLDEDD